MAISAHCPSCEAKFNLADEMAGKKVKCSKCENVFAVPEAEESASDSAKTGIASVVLPAPSSRSDEEDDDDNDRGRGKSGGPPPLSKNRSSRSSRRSDRRERKSPGDSSMMTIVLVLVGGGVLLSCCVCSGVGGYFMFGTKAPKDPVQVAVNNPAKVEDPIKNGNDLKKKQEIIVMPPPINKQPQNNPPPIIVGGTNVVFGPTGMFQSNNFLNVGDPEGPPVNNRYKVYTVQLEANRRYQIDMISVEFDTYLYLLDDTNFIVAQDDDSGGNLNARIEFRPNRTGTYRILTSSFGAPAVGAFTLTVRRF